MSARCVYLDQRATSENYVEDGYLHANPDVANAVAEGHFLRGRQHFDMYGWKENRKIRLSHLLAPLRQAKIARLRPHILFSMAHRWLGDKYDFLTENLRREAAIVDTANVSANLYPPDATALIERYADGLVLDCGAGKRGIYYENVVNLEVVDYDSTDILGVGEHLPFADASFDAVISIAVLEHVRDPFTCAREIARVLKPGGELYAEVPFLQPLHGFPHHYYNMTHQGLRALFEDYLTVGTQRVDPHGLPIKTLTWYLEEWAKGLPDAAREEFLSLRIGDLTQYSDEMLNKPWVRDLSEDSNFQLASVTSLRAHKPKG